MDTQIKKKQAQKIEGRISLNSVVTLNHGNGKNLRKV